jgi:RNA polymerase sigma factor (sigma-70 family)
VRNILYDGYLGKRLPREVQLQRVRNVIREELTRIERETLTAYYFQEMNIAQIAQARGVNKSTVSRTLKRAEARLQKYLKY